ncbi:hypothetical protein LMxysn_0782 [Listeria monocytogenes]|nr:hypothetical protein LMxysn_0782 [Listeria monocytogenes]
MEEMQSALIDVFGPLFEQLLQGEMDIARILAKTKEAITGAMVTEIKR